MVEDFVKDVLCVSFQDVIFSCCTLIIGFLHLNIVIFLLHIHFIVLVLINKAEKYKQRGKRKKEIKKKKKINEVPEDAEIARQS